MTTRALEAGARALNPRQLQFLDLHRHHLVTRWQWCFGDAMLRACTDHECATISRSDLDELIASGVMQRGPGWSLNITDPHQ
jgi:hypothetical protein